MFTYTTTAQEDESGEVTFYMKGADMVMQSIVQYNDWLDEEVCVLVIVQWSMFVSRRLSDGVC